MGPFVAVGKPGEKLPELGAARMYLQDSEWKDKVHDLMSRASLVVLRAGRTDGLWWEAQMAAAIVKPERLVFLLPYQRAQYQLFRSNAETIFGRRLPDYPQGKKESAAGSVQGNSCTSSPTGRRTFSNPGFLPGCETLGGSFKVTLQPVFKQLHVDVTIPKMSLGKALLFLLLVVLSPILALAALFVVFWVIGQVVALLGN